MIFRFPKGQQQKTELFLTVRTINRTPPYEKSYIEIWILKGGYRGRGGGAPIVPPFLKSGFVCRIFHRNFHKKWSVAFRCPAGVWHTATKSCTYVFESHTFLCLFATLGTFFGPGFANGVMNICGGYQDPPPGFYQVITFV